MALLYSPRFQAFDASGNPISGARLYTFDSVSTSTPKATYSDNSLTISYGAYVTADSSGVFPPIFGAANESYYMVLRTSADVFVDEFPFATTLGPDSSSVFLKDLGTNGRFQVSGDAGVVQIETGNAEGDDIGGSGRIGGFDGTQGDALELDYAGITATGPVSVTGAVTASGALVSTSGDVTLEGISRAVPRCTSRGTATAAATTDLTLDSDYEAWEIHIRNYQVLGVSGGTPSMRLSFDGSTYKTTSGDYSYGSVIQSGATATAVAWAATATYVPVGNANSGASGTGGGGDIIIRITSTSAHETHYRADFLHYSAATSGDRTSGWIAGSTPVKSFGKVAKVRIFDIVGGNLTFDYAVIGLP